MEDLKMFDVVKISDDAVADQELSKNAGVIGAMWDEPLANSEPTPLVKVLFNDGTFGVVGQHEVTKVSFETKKKIFS